MREKMIREECWGKQKHASEQRDLRLLINIHTQTNNKCVVNACNSGSPVKIFSIIVCCINGDRMKHQNSYNGFLAQHLLLKFLLFFCIVIYSKALLSKVIQVIVELLYLLQRS